MSKLSLEAITKVRGDCTVGYHVNLHGATYSVDEFIHIVLSERPNEWGTIKIVSNKRRSLCYGEVEYKDGTIVNDQMDQLSPRVYLKTVISANAGGGWTNMNYCLFV